LAQPDGRIRHAVCSGLVPGCNAIAGSVDLAKRRLDGIARGVESVGQAELLPGLRSLLLPGFALFRTQTGLAHSAGVLSLALGPPVLVLAAQYAWFARDAGVVFAPLVVWRMFAQDRILLTVVLGIAFPLMVLVCYPRKVTADRSIMLAWVTLAIAIGTFACFSEAGARQTHGNFGWGLVYADHVLFVTSTTILLRQPIGFRRILCLVLFGLH
jgi:hypothetical protein